MSEEGVTISLETIFEQGQETQRRVTAIEHKVDDLAVVNERLAKHSAQIDGAGAEIASLKTSVATQEVTISWLRGTVKSLIAAVTSIAISVIVYWVTSR